MEPATSVYILETNQSVNMVSFNQHDKEMVEAMARTKSTAFLSHVSNGVKRVIQKRKVSSKVSWAQAFPELKELLKCNIV